MVINMITFISSILLMVFDQSHSRSPFPFCILQINEMVRTPSMFLTCFLFVCYLGISLKCVTKPVTAQSEFRYGHTASGHAPCNFSQRYVSTAHVGQHGLPVQLSSFMCVHIIFHLLRFFLPQPLEHVHYLFLVGNEILELWSL